MRIIQLDGVRHRGIRQRGISCRYFPTTVNGTVVRTAIGQRARPDDLAPRQIERTECDPDMIDQQILRAFEQTGGIASTGGRDELREATCRGDRIHSEF